MNTFKTLVLASTALVFAGAAMAGNDNKLFVDQKGNNGELEVYQRGNNNQAGGETTPHRILQLGDRNTMEIYQDGNANKAGVRNGGIDQKGNRNLLKIYQPGNRNEIKTVTQFGTNGNFRSNDLIVSQKSDGNTIEQITQDADGVTSSSQRNKMEVLQRTGNGNLIKRAEQDGSSNDMTLDQVGSRNLIKAALQGDFNDKGSDATGLSNVNGEMYIQQAGDNNVVELAQQDGKNHFMELKFTGDGNGGTGFSAPLMTAISGKAGFGQGSAVQAGDRNSLKVGIRGNRNAFLFFQGGSYNEIEGYVNNGSLNQIAIYQDSSGMDNRTEFNINGDRNVLGVAQSGTGNFIKATQNGNGNLADAVQSGMNNSMTIVQ